jgi:HSP20 family protein
MTRIVFNTMNPFERIAKSIEDAVGSVERNEKQAMCCLPKVDIYEADKKYNVILELPGLNKEDVTISINEENVLTVKGEKKSESDLDKRTFHRYERAFGTFERKFTLPENVDRDDIKAKFENGLLNIEIAQKEPEKPQEINISIS